MTERLLPFRRRLLLGISIVFSVLMTMGSVVSLVEGSLQMYRFVPLLAVLGSWVSLFFAMMKRSSVKCGYLLLVASVSFVIFVLPLVSPNPSETFNGFFPLVFSLSMVFIVLSSLFGLPWISFGVACLFFVQLFTMGDLSWQNVFSANVILIIISVTLIAFLAVRYHLLVGRMISDLIDAIEENRQLSELSVTDPLTGLYNRRHIEVMLLSECERVKRYSGSLSCLMIDVDHFKRFNDTYGHQRGDEVLRQVGAAMMDASRKSDMCGRYGGEEFIILSPVDISHGVQFGERLRTIIDSLSFELPGEVASVTVSIGIAEYEETCDDAKELVRRADEALYRAKVSGRDRTEVFANDPR